MKKRKLLNIFILVIICLFAFNIDVKGASITCNYSANNKKVKIIINGLNLNSTYVDESTSTSVPFFPMNGVYWNRDNKNYYFLNQVDMNNREVGLSKYLYYINTSQKEVLACPSNIVNYYETKEFEYDIIGEVLYESVNSSSNIQKLQDMPVIYYSNVGKTATGKNTTLYLDPNKKSLDFVPRSDYDEYNKKVIYYLESAIEDVGTTTTTEGYKECSYKNNLTSVIYDFRFKPNDYRHKYKTSQNNTWKDISLIGGSYSFSNCPEVIKWPDSSREEIEISDVSSCPYDNNMCFYRTDVLPYYSDLSYKVYKYIMVYGGQSHDNISIKLLKKSENGKDIKITLFDDSEIEVTNLSEYESAFKSNEVKKFPRYLIKEKEENNYKFSNDKGNKEFDKVYIYAGFFDGIQGLGEKQVYNTCRDLFGSNFLTFLEDNVFGVVRIGVIILLILLTTVDFAKVVFIDDKEGIQNAFKNFRRRAIAAVLIFLTPTIIIFIANLVGAGESVQECAKTIRNMSTEVSQTADE